MALSCLGLGLWDGGGAQCGRSPSGIRLQLPHDGVSGEDSGAFWGIGGSRREAALRVLLSLADCAFELQTGIKLEADGNSRGNPVGSGELGQGQRGG